MGPSNDNTSLVKIPVYTRTGPKSNPCWQHVQYWSNSPMAIGGARFIPSRKLAAIKHTASSTDSVGWRLDHQEKLLGLHTVMAISKHTHILLSWDDYQLPRTAQVITFLLFLKVNILVLNQWWWFCETLLFNVHGFTKCGHWKSLPKACICTQWWHLFFFNLTLTQLGIIFLMEFCFPMPFPLNVNFGMKLV